MLGLCLSILLAQANAQNSHSEPSNTAVDSATRRSASRFIVIGFLGGFVAHDEPHHPELRLIETLRQEYPTDAYFGLFENKKVGDALTLILRRLDVNQDGVVSDDEKRNACIGLFGHSWGASAVVALARRLNRERIPVRLTVQVDSVAKPFHNDSVIPSNVSQAANFYQTRGLIHGRQKIVAADPSRTTILGNFRLEYRSEPAECRTFPWHARLLTKSHIEIECDPKVWSQVAALLKGPLSAREINQTGSSDSAASHEVATGILSTKDTRQPIAGPVTGAKP